MTPSERLPIRMNDLFAEVTPADEIQKLAEGAMLLRRFAADSAKSMVIYPQRVTVTNRIFNPVRTRETQTEGPRSGVEEAEWCKKQKYSFFDPDNRYRRKISGVNAPEDVRLDLGQSGNPTPSGLRRDIVRHTLDEVEEYLRTVRLVELYATVPTTYLFR